ncbi:hypothetical protein FEM54_29310 [Pseudomonas edaphica]|uniref:Uncharacterized protein n=1 Tax=Pseudomonas edaphica TaxID=2006980 RepID=A0ABY2TWE2_9PSED|nr:hypothetical protein FEM54_29310 [Pseudomonas edaphica]
MHTLKSCFSVGAGLPAMQTPRYIRYTELTLSQASQLPPLTEYGSAVAAALTSFGPQVSTKNTRQPKRLSVSLGNSRNNAR